MINYCVMHSMGSLNVWPYHRRGQIYKYLFHEKEAYIWLHSYVFSFG
jgi:hypothetical protein